MTTALTRRYGSALIRKAAMAHPAYRYGSLAYRYGPTAFKYGSRAVRWAYKRYQKKKRKKGPAKKARQSIGEQIGTSSCKNRIQSLDSAFSSRSTRTLYIEDLCNIPHTPGEKNQRERNIINIRGFKICMAVKNNNNIPLYLNVALLSPKNQGGITVENFWRSNGEERGQDFSSNQPSLAYHCLNINTDKFYILKHKRYRLAHDNPAGGTLFQDNKGNSFMNLDWYVKLKRQIRYDRTDTSLPIDGAVYLVYYADGWTASQGSAPVANAFEVMQRHITYFRESKTCC